MVSDVLLEMVSSSLGSSYLGVFNLRKCSRVYTGFLIKKKKNG